MSLMEARTAAYEQLYSGGHFQASEQQSDVLPVPKRIKQSQERELIYKLGIVVPEIVSGVLDWHNQADDAVFRPVQPVMPAVKGLASSVIQRWDTTRIAQYRTPVLTYGGNPLTDAVPDLYCPEQSFESRGLVIETAATILHLMSIPQLCPHPLNLSSHNRKELLKVITDHGSMFAESWMNGSFMAARLREQGREDEIDEWNRFMTPGIRKRFLSTYNNPLAAAIEAKEALGMLTDDFMERELGWPHEEVREVMTYDVRRQLATRNKDVVAGLRKLKQKIESLNDEAIAERLGWSEAEVRELFSPEWRRRIALKHKDPMVGIENAAARYKQLTPEIIAGVLECDVSQLAALPLNLRKELSIGVYAQKDPIMMLKNVRNNLNWLTDEQLVEILHPMISSPREAKSVTLPNWLSIYSSDNPLAHLHKVRERFIRFTIDAISKHLIQQEGEEWTNDYTAKVFSLAFRRYIAARAEDPLATALAYVRGDFVPAGWTKFRTRRLKRESTS